MRQLLTLGSLKIPWVGCHPDNFARGRVKGRVINGKYDPGSTAILGVCLHTSGGGYQSLQDWFNFSQRERARRLKVPLEKAMVSSANWGIDLDGDWCQFVQTKDTPFAQGRVYQPSAKLVLEQMYPGRKVFINPNAYLLSIECVDEGKPTTIARRRPQIEKAASIIAAASVQFKFPIDADHEFGHNRVFVAKACPGNLPVQRILDVAREMLT